MRYSINHYWTLQRSGAKQGKDREMLRERRESREERPTDVHFYLNNNKKNLKWPTVVIISTCQHWRVPQNNKFWKYFTSLFLLQLWGRKYAGIKYDTPYMIYGKSCLKSSVLQMWSSSVSDFIWLRKLKFSSAFF